MNKYKQYANSEVDRLVTTKNKAIPKIATAKPEKEHTIIFTNSNKPSTGQPQGQPQGRARKICQKRNPQRKEARKRKERLRVTEKFIDVVCMKSQRGEEPIQAQHADDNSSNTLNEHTSTTTVDAYGEDESSEA